MHCVLYEQTSDLYSHEVTINAIFPSFGNTTTDSTAQSEGIFEHKDSC